MFYLDGGKIGGFEVVGNVMLLISSLDKSLILSGSGQICIKTKITGNIQMF